MNFDQLTKHKPGEVRSVTSSANEAIKLIRSLHMKKYREESGLYLAEGARTLIEALELGQKPVAIAYLANARTETTIARIVKAVKTEKGLCLEVNQQALDKISARDNPQTIVGIFYQRTISLSQIETRQTRILVLEEVRDPGNLGTILRTCDGFGINTLILVGNYTDPFGLEAVRASMGSIFSVKLAPCSHEEFMRWLSAYKGAVIGTALEGAQDIDKANWRKPYLLLMGNEQKGLSAPLRECCTQLVKIPMSGRADSFNLAVATGIALYCAVNNNA
jgi:TrmH family RNA methyltransferase